MPVHNIETVQDFEKILEEHPNVMIDWFATWCGPCKAIAPHIVKQANEEKNKDIWFGKIDVDVLGDLSKKYGIRSMPTLQMFKDGDKVRELVGPNPWTLDAFLSGPTEETVKDSPDSQGAQDE
jgi:thioredoxin 1